MHCAIKCRFRKVKAHNACSCYWSYPWWVTDNSQAQSEMKRRPDKSNRYVAPFSSQAALLHLTHYIHTYVYICMCVCVCVCVYNTEYERSCHTFISNRNTFWNMRHCSLVTEMSKEISASIFKIIREEFLDYRAETQVNNLRSTQHHISKEFILHKITY